MSTVDDIIRAIDHEGSTSWEIADEVAALDELDEATGKPLTLSRCRSGSRPNAVSSGRRSRSASIERPRRHFRIGSTTTDPQLHRAQELRAHPDKLLNWKPKKTGDVLTVERARALRGRRARQPDDSVEEQARKLVDKLDRLAELTRHYWSTCCRRCSMTGGNGTRNGSRSAVGLPLSPRTCEACGDSRRWVGSVTRPARRLATASDRIAGSAMRSGGEGAGRCTA